MTAVPSQDHLTCGGFDAWIVVNGAKATAYDIQRGEEEQVNCWISSATDREFSISFCRKAKEKYDYIAKVILDGHLAARYIYRKQLDDPDGLATQTISGSRVSIVEERAFAFGSLELTDDDMHLGDPSSQNIGEIRLMIRRAEAIGLIYPEVPTYTVPSAGKVHERTKKGLVHQIKYGSTSEIIHEDEPGVASLPQGGWITFIFNYRPLEMLQAMGVAPFASSFSEALQSIPQTPTNSMKKRDISAVKMETSDEDKLEEAEDIFAKEQELIAELERVRCKLRAMKEGARFEKKPKPEPKTYFVLTVPGEVIDLT